MKKHDWTIWSIGEGLTKTVARILQKFVSNTTNTFGGTLLASGIVGLVQVLISLPILKIKGIKIFERPALIIGCIISGALAQLATIFGFLTFLNKGDIGTSTFIVTLSIVPGAIFDIIFFKYRPRVKELFGILIAILAGWIMLGFPTSGANLPLWIWLSFGTMIAVATNQAVTQSLKKAHPMFLNFWGGITALIICILILINFGHDTEIINSLGNQNFWLYSSAIGILVVIMWSFSLISYKDGAGIALKKLVVNGTYFIMTFIVGYLFFQEQITINKILAIPLFFLAYVLMKKEAWKVISQKYKSIVQP